MKQVSSATQLPSQKEFVLHSVYGTTCRATIWGKVSGHVLSLNSFKLQRYAEYWG